MLLKAHQILGLAGYPPLETLNEAREILTLLDGDAGQYRVPGERSSRVIDYLAGCPDLEPCVRTILESCRTHHRDRNQAVAPGGPFATGGIIIAALPAGSPYGFPSAGDTLPRIALVRRRKVEDAGIITLALPDAYLERILKKTRWLHLLAQIVLREILEGFCSTSRTRTRISELRFNSFETHGSMLSDLTRDMLETCADQQDFSTLEQLAGNSSAFLEEIRALPGDAMSQEERELMGEMIRSISQEAEFLLNLSRIEDHSTGTPLNITPKDIIFETTRAELAVEEFPVLYTPPYLAGALKKSLETAGAGNDPNSGVRVLRDIIAYKTTEASSAGTDLLDTIQEWVDLYLDFSEKNITSLSILQSGIMSDQDIEEVKSIIEGMIDILHVLSRDESRDYLQELADILGIHGDGTSVALALNRLINRIHQGVLKNVFGVFKGWKAHISEVNTIASKAVSITVDHAGRIEYFPASKVNILDYSGDFREGRAVVARKIIEAYLTTNIHLRDNCYIDCISHTTKAWFFVDLGVHGANIFVDVDPNKALITASYAEGDVEDGNMARLRLLMDCLEELGFAVTKTEITLTARLDEKSAGVLGTHEIIRRAIRTIQAFASVADFDQEIEDGRITQRSLKFHSQRISSSGTGYPLYLMTKGSIALKKLAELLTLLTVEVLSTLNQELLRLGLDPVHEDGAGQKLIDAGFNQQISLGLNRGRFLSYSHPAIVQNPLYVEADPKEVFERIDDQPLSDEMASMVTILDKITGSTPIGSFDGNRVTATRLELVDGTITFYALRDQNTYQALNAYVVDGPRLRRVSGYDNQIQNPSVVRTLLWQNGYNLDMIEQFTQWTMPKVISLKGISIQGIISCPGLATGFLKRNRPERGPEDFQHSIYFDHILTPQDVGRLRHASGFITSGDSILSHAQLTARTFGKPGVIIPGARWTDEGDESFLVLPMGTHGCRVGEGHIITVHGFRGTVTIVGASERKEEDFSTSISEVFSLLISTDENDHDENAPACLREIISRTDNPEILKFIAQELFISTSSPRDKRRPELLRSLLDDSHPEFRDMIRDFLRDIALEDRGRQKRDIDMARMRIAQTSDMNEARFIRDKIATQLTLFDEVDRLLSERLALARLDFHREADEIAALYERRLLAHVHCIISEIETTLAPDDVPMEGIESAWQKISLLSRLSSGSPSGEHLLTRISAQLQARVNEIRNSFRESSRRYVVDLGETRGFLAGYTGNKAATLGSLMNSQPDLMIPGGFVLTSLGIRKLLDHNQEKIQLIDALLHESRVSGPELLAEVRGIATGLAWPSELKDTILECYHELERGADTTTKIAEITRIAERSGMSLPDLSRLENKGTFDQLTICEMIQAIGLDRQSMDSLYEVCRSQSGIFVVVRSSSVLEDTHEEMMAGRFKSYPYIRGTTLLLESILRCLAYYWVELSAVTDTQPVLIHTQVESDTAMVINSINLADQRWDEVMINSAKGAGAGLVSGRTDSDLFLVDANTFCIRRSVNPRKKTRTVFDHEKGYGTKTAPIENSSEQIKASLSDGDASQAARIARMIHSSLGYPVDIEAVLKDGTIYVVQVRPIVLPFSRAIKRAR
ncbi:MAG: PEP/pyruvate-binding domain-containing protein [Desulfomonilia bacterium]